jgi:hypothetical protein
MGDRMLFRRCLHLLCGFGLAASFCIAAMPASAQVRELLQELVRPAGPPEDEPLEVPEAEERRAPHIRPGMQPRSRSGYWEGIREQMSQLRESCHEGDRRSCVRLGIIIGENKERRALWRREDPELFWYER